MEELETLERFECPECPGPPPEFRLPPPPRPPFLTEGTFCPETIPDLEDCGAFPMIDPSYHTNPSLQSTALIITCAVVLLLMAAIVSVVFWKHKRKVQNILPCKSAAGAAAAGRVRVLPDGGQPMGGAMGVTGNAVLYEDLPETGVLPQLHNHHLGGGHHHHHQSAGQPTIEVRGTNHSAWQPRSKMERIPAPHHLDYLDYRDPRSILRVAEKPSRAVLGGYRTPRALLAKSQGVPLSIATHVVTTQNNNDRASAALARTLDNYDNCPPALLTAPNPRDRPQISFAPNESPNRDDSPRNPSSSDPTLILVNDDDDRGLVDRENIANYNSNVAPDIGALRSMKLSRNRDNHDSPITPTHRSRLRPSANTIEQTIRPNSSRDSATSATSFPRRTSVDSEGYSYIDFDDKPRDEKTPSKPRLADSPIKPVLTYRNRNDSIDSEGYSYIDPYYGRAPGSARRLPNYRYTDEEVCPLCTMQQIQYLLARPEDTYRQTHDT